MSGASDHDLLARFVRQREEAAFTAIVERYLPLVRSAALRQLRDPHTADDVAQAVFIVLARKAPRLRAPLAGWLLKTTHYCSIDVRKINRRRVNHEQKVAAMREESYVPAPPGDLAEYVDESLAALGQTDRNALALHFLQQEPLSAVAAALGLSEVAARKRIERALQKLRARLSRSSGGSVNALAFPAVLAAVSARSAPTVSVATVSQIALHAGSPLAAHSAAGLISKGTLHMMNVAKLKIAAGLTLATLAAGSLSYGVLRPALAQSPAAPAASPAPASAQAVTANPAAGSMPANPLGLEIVAVGPYGEENHEWWRPAGGKLDFDPPVKFKRTANTPGPDEKLYEIAIKTGTSTVPFEDLIWNSIYSSNYMDAAGWCFICFRAPAGDGSASLHIDYSKGPWKSTMVLRGSEILGMMSVQGSHEISFVGLMQEANAVDLVVTDDLMPGKFLPRRYVAIEKGGQETPTFGSTVSAKTYTLSKVAFPGLKAADIESVRCEVHPLDSWLQFDNISLDGKSTKPAISSGTIPVPDDLKLLAAAKDDARGGPPSPARPGEWPGFALS